MRWQQRLNAFLKRLRQILQDEDLHYRFLALFLAIILWFFAGGHGRLLTNERAVTLQPEVIGLPADYALLGQPGPVRIVIRGTNTAISRVEETARAVVDLSSAIEGEGTYAVEVSLLKVRNWSVLPPGGLISPPKECWQMIMLFMWGCWDSPPITT